MFRSIHSLLTNRRTAKYHDVDGNGRYESLGYDTNRDGTSEYLKADSNRDGIYDGNWITVQPATTFTPYGAAVKTALDMWMTGVNNRMVAIWLT